MKIKKINQLKRRITIKLKRDDQLPALKTPQSTIHKPPLLKRSKMSG